MSAVEGCVYCQRPFSATVLRTRDHIIPKLLGNRGPHNIVPACLDCNRLKGQMTPDAMDMMARDLASASGRYAAMAQTVRQLMADRGLV